ncbi:MAG: GNAT family N-acetyltransferase [Tractidigestivibacter sp.]|jgi:L-amino acid N-acyltransferase YncA|uniref:GNAT family N-acetyltransferase n=1 Tax=Tractidigestivibacter sp. TaxID=2847320 RepID=UPI003D8CE016
MPSFDSGVTIRRATNRDAAQLVAIYAPYVEKTAITFEYSVPSVEEFAARIDEISAGYPYLVAEDASGAALGYAYAHAYYGRDAYAWCVELSIYLRQDARGNHLGTRLYGELERCLAAMGVINLYACVTSTDRKGDPYVTPASVLFHQALGFHEIGAFKNCGMKFGRWYDTVWLERDLSSHESGNLSAPIPFPQVAAGVGY